MPKFDFKVSSIVTPPRWPLTPPRSPPFALGIHPQPPHELAWNRGPTVEAPRLAQSRDRYAEWAEGAIRPD